MINLREMEHTPKKMATSTQVSGISISDKAMESRVFPTERLTADHFLKMSSMVTGS